MDSQTVLAFRAAANRLATASAAERRSIVDSLLETAGARPPLRQDAADAVCAWLREPVTQIATSELAPRVESLRLLADRLRPAGAEAAWDGVYLDLSGASLFDLDLSGCHLAGARFADTRFHGTTTFADARFDQAAEFWRAVFHGDASFAGTRFGGDAEFGRTRFRSRADFTGATFAAMAWFGRGEETWWDDDEAWDTVEDIDPAPWDEPNEDDPQWPVAVLEGDYQDWEEGGDGARFAGDASFRRVSFHGPAWFYSARFARTAAFDDARFDGRAHLDQPVVDLTGARWSADTQDGPSVWPLGWTVRPGTGGDLLPDASVAPYHRQLADTDPAVRSDGLHMLAALGDGRPELRQDVVTALCAFLRIPIPFDLYVAPARRSDDAGLRVRKTAQDILTDRLRPGPGYWPGMSLWLCGATLVDFDLSGCHVEYGDFTGAQFHGLTRLDGSVIAHAMFALDGTSGHATFHGDVVCDGDVPAPRKPAPT